MFMISQLTKYWCEALFFAIIEMITYGYQITSKKLKAGGKRYSFLIFIIIGGINSLRMIFNDVVLFITAGIYLICLRHFILNICANKKKLTRQILLINSIGIDATTTPPWKKLRFYNVLRIALIFTMVLLAAGNIITKFFLELMPWVSACGHLSVLFICYLILFVFLRIKKRDYITGLIGELQLDSEGPMISLADISRGMLRGNLQPWD